MIALVCAWHQHHERAAREVGRRLDGGETLIVAAPALVEAYAVLTRLPPPHRLSPSNSRALLAGNFMSDGVEVVVLDTFGYEHLLRGAPERGIMGGAIYDAVILACALAARVDILLTFNERQFQLLAGGRIEVVVPA